jgi:hypothetical protein
LDNHRDCPQAIFSPVWSSLLFHCGLLTSAMH